MFHLFYEIVPFSFGQLLEIFKIAFSVGKLDLILKGP